MNRLLLAFIFVFCLFSIKVNVFGPLRIDELLVLIVVVYFFSLKNKLVLLTPPIYFFLIFISWSFISTFYNSYNGRVNVETSFLFSLRHLEYLVFVVLGFLLAKFNFDFNKALAIYLIYVVCLVVLQTLYIVPVFSEFTPERAIANTAGPWELAAVSSFLSLYFLERRKWLLFLFSFAILVLTGSRVTFIASIFVLIIYYNDIFGSNSKNIIYLTLLIVITIFIPISWLVYSDSYINTLSFDGIFSRINTFFYKENIEAVIGALLNQQSVANAGEYRDFLDSFILDFDSFVDPSSIVRFTNWGVLIASSLGNMDTVLLGLGPSFAGKAVDGHYMRFYIETGLLGLILFFIFVFSFYWTVKDRFLRAFMFVLLLTALFIDVFTTYKAMLLFWVFYGKYLFQSKRQFLRSEKLDWIKGH